MWPSHDSGRQDPVRRIGQDLTAAFSAAPESSQQIQGSTAHEIGDSPDSALSLSLSGFLVTLGRRGWSSAIDEAHTEQPVWEGSVIVRTEGPRTVTGRDRECLTVRHDS